MLFPPHSYVTFCMASLGSHLLTTLVIASAPVYFAFLLFLPFPLVVFLLHCWHMWCVRTSLLSMLSPFFRITFKINYIKYLPSACLLIFPHSSPVCVKLTQLVYFSGRPAVYSIPWDLAHSKLFFLKFCDVNGSLTGHKILGLQFFPLGFLENVTLLLIFVALALFSYPYI